MKSERLVHVNGKTYIAVTDDRSLKDNDNCDKCMFVNGNLCNFYLNHDGMSIPGCYIHTCSYYKPFDDQHINDTKLN